jgi:hypothetical protein
MPKKNSLRKFKRADLEVSDKIGKGAYGGVWQVWVCLRVEGDRRRKMNATVGYRGV